MKEFDEIAKIIQNYGLHGKDQDVDTLLNIQDRLVSAGFWLGGFVGDLTTDYNEKYFIRKLTISKKTQGLINSGKSAAASENEQSLKARKPIRKKPRRTAAPLKLTCYLNNLIKF